MLKNTLIILLFFIGCASIPKSTYQVSEIIGDGIKSNEKAYLELVDKYFEEKRQKIDMWIVRVYFPRLIDNIKVELNKANMEVQLSENQYEDIVATVIEKRDDMQLELEKARVIVIERVRSNYSELIRANADLTQLLKSSADLKDAIEKQIDKTTGIKFDFDEFDKSFDTYIDNTDKAVNQGGKLYDKVEKYVK